MVNTVVNLASTKLSGVPPKRRRRSRCLPEIGDRCAISLHISASVDVKLEIFTALDGKMKNEVFLESMHEFFADDTSSGPIHESRSGAKVRVTFILTKELEEQLNAFVESRRCSTASAVTAALGAYFKTHYDIDLLKDPSRDRIIQALRS